MVCWRKSVERAVLLFVISGAPCRWFGSHRVWLSRDADNRKAPAAERGAATGAVRHRSPNGTALMPARRARGGILTRLSKLGSNSFHCCDQN